MSDDEEEDTLDSPEPMYFCDNECTCDHEPEDHGWTECSVDECKCEAGWEY